LDIFSTWASKYGDIALRGCLFVGLVLMSAWMLSCRKKNICENCNETLTPPLGIAFSIPSGDVSFFSLHEPRVVETQHPDNITAVAAMLSRYGNHLILANGSGNRIYLYDVPDFSEPISSAMLGGQPVDVAVDDNAHTMYAVTLNGNLWRYSPSSGLMDTVGLALHPRRMVLRQPDHLMAWIVCSESKVIQSVDLRTFTRADSLLTALTPTAIEFSPDGTKFYVAYTGDYGELAEYNAGDKQFLRSQAFGSGPFELAMSYEGRYLAASDSASRRVYFWDLAHDSIQSVGLAGTGGRVRFSRQSNSCYVAMQNRSSLIHLELSEQGFATQDTLDFSRNLHEFVLWE
jgi:DNA-binding beta-propeller fold protein YncE